MRCAVVCYVVTGRKLELRTVVKHCVRLKTSGVEILNMFQKADGNEAMVHTQYFEFHAHFKNGRASVEDDD